MPCLAESITGFGLAIRSDAECLLCPPDGAPGYPRLLRFGLDFLCQPLAVRQDCAQKIFRLCPGRAVTVPSNRLQDFIGGPGNRLITPLDPRDENAVFEQLLFNSK
jgi:hypothetical protein